MKTFEPGNRVCLPGRRAGLVVVKLYEVDGVAWMRAAGLGNASQPIVTIDARAEDFELEQ